MTLVLLAGGASISRAGDFRKPYFVTAVRRQEFDESLIAG
jgi:hypothetical protein